VGVLIELHRHNSLALLSFFFFFFDFFGCAGKSLKVWCEESLDRV